VTVVGVIFLMLAFAFLAARPTAFPWLLAATVPFPHTAALVIAGNALSPFYMLAIIAVLRLVYLVIRERRWGFKAPVSRIATIAALIFLGYSIVISLVGPFLFEGIEVFAPRAGLDEQVLDQSTLAFSISNLAQPLYLLLGAGVVLYLGREKRVSAAMFDLTVWLGVGLALVRLMLPAAWPVALIENIPNVSYAVTQEGLRGTFSEPSLFGLFLVAAFGYSVVRIFVATGWRRWAMVATVAIVVLELAVNLSFTAIGALGIVIAIGGVVVVVAITRGRRALRVWIGSIAAVFVIVGIVAFPWISAIVGGVFDEKLSSDSFHNRAVSNGVAYSVFTQTWGLGAGLGSNRPSSLFALLLSCVGLIGTVAFFAVVVLVLLGVLRHRSLWPAGAGLLGVVVAQVTSAPELSIPVFWMLLALTFWAPVLVETAEQREPLYRRMLSRAPRNA